MVDGYLLVWPSYSCLVLPLSCLVLPCLVLSCSFCLMSVSHEAVTTLTPSFSACRIWCLVSESPCRPWMQFYYGSSNERVHSFWLRSKCCWDAVMYEGKIHLRTNYRPKKKREGGGVIASWYRILVGTKLLILMFISISSGRSTTNKLRNKRPKLFFPFCGLWREPGLF